MNTCGNAQFPRPVDGRVAINSLLLNELMSQALYRPDAGEINVTLGDLTIRVTAGRRLEVDWFRHVPDQCDVRFTGQATLLPPRMEFAVPEAPEGGPGAPVLLIEFPMHFNQLSLSVDFLANPVELFLAFPEEVRAGEGASLFNHVEVAFRYVLELVEVGGDDALPTSPLAVPERVLHCVGFRDLGDDAATWFPSSDARWLNAAEDGAATPYGLSPLAVPPDAERLSQSLLTDGDDEASPVSRKLQLLLQLVNGDVPVNPPLPGVTWPTFAPLIPGIQLVDPPAGLPANARTVERLRQVFRLFAARAGQILVGQIRTNIVQQLGIGALADMPADLVPLLAPVELHPLTALDETGWTPSFHRAARLLFRDLGTVGHAVHQAARTTGIGGDSPGFIDVLSAPAGAQWAVLPGNPTPGIPDEPGDQSSWLVVGYSTAYLTLQYLASVYRDQFIDLMINESSATTAGSRAEPCDRG